MNAGSRFVAGVAIGVAATAGIYALAATTATHWAASFAKQEQASHARMGEFDNALKQEQKFERIAAGAP